MCPSHTVLDVTEHNVWISTVLTKTKWAIYSIKEKTKYWRQRCKNWQLPRVTPGQKLEWFAHEKKREGKKIDLSHSVTQLVPAKPYRAEHREEFPRAQISSCCPMLGQQACHHPLASSIFLRMWWWGRLTSLESVRPPESCCRLPGMWDSVSIYHWQYPWKQKSAKAIRVIVSSGLKSPSDCNRGIISYHRQKKKNAVSLDQFIQHAWKFCLKSASQTLFYYFFIQITSWYILDVRLTS